MPKARTTNAANNGATTNKKPAQPAELVQPAENDAQVESLVEAPAIHLLSRAEAMALLSISDELIFETMLKAAGLDRKAAQFEAQQIAAIAKTSPVPMLGESRVPPSIEAALAEANNTQESTLQQELPKRGEAMGRAIDVHEQIAAGSFEELVHSYEALSTEQAVELLERGELAFRTVLTEGTLALHQVRMQFVNQMIEQSRSTTHKLVDGAEALEKKLDAQRQASASRTSQQSSTKADFFKALERKKQK